MIRTRTIAIATLCLFAGGTPAVASHLITSKDVKNGTLAEVDLRPSVRSKLNSPGPAGQRGAEGAQGPQGARGATGPQGEQGVAGERGLRGSQGPQGEQGPQGPKGADSTVAGPAGPQGPVGPAGPGSKIETSVKAQAHSGRAAANTEITLDFPAQCDEGVAMGGGWQPGSGPTGVEYTVLQSYPDGTRWVVRATVKTDEAGDFTFTTYTTCIAGT